VGLGTRGSRRPDDPKGKPEGIFNDLPAHMDHERGAFKMKGHIWARLLGALQKKGATKIAIVTEICLLNTPFAGDACIQAV
jgi:hypothetical protein